jgi:branched-chain amino acid transport system substrate-binding protein
LFASLGAAGVAAPLLSACNRSDDTNGTGGGNRARGSVRIGLLVPQTGSNKFIGDDMLQGFELFRGLNGGRLGGYDIDLVIADEGETADTGKAGVEKLIKQDKVMAISGVASSLVMSAVRDTIEAAHIPLVGSNASPTNLLNTLYIWRTSYVDNEPGAALGELVASRIGNTGTAFMIAPEGIGRDGIAGFQTTFTAKSGTIDGPAVYTPPGQLNFAQYLNPLKNSDVKAVFSFFSGAAAEAFVKQYHQSGLKATIPLYGPGFLTEGTALLKAQQDAAKDVWTSLNYSPDLDNAANRKFAAEYQKKHQVNPTTYAMASYDAAAVIDKALSLVDGELTGENLNAAIGRVGQISSPRGDWQFNQNRSPLQKWYLRQVRLDGAVLTNNIVSELATLG